MCLTAPFHNTETAKDVRKGITEAAHELWQEFLEIGHVKHEPENLLFPHVCNACVEAFAQHCASAVLDRFDDPGNSAHYFFADVAKDHPGGGIPASWLMYDPYIDDKGVKRDRAAIVIDTSILDRDPGEINRLLTYLLLHEIGHILFHWQVLITQEGRPPQNTHLTPL